MDADDCRELALLYREVAEETRGDERDGLIAIAIQLEEIADEEDGSTPRTLH